MAYKFKETKLIRDKAVKSVNDFVNYFDKEFEKFGTVKLVSKLS